MTDRMRERLSDEVTGAGCRSMCLVEFKKECSGVQSFDTFASQQMHRVFNVSTRGAGLSPARLHPSIHPSLLHCNRFIRTQRLVSHVANLRSNHRPLYTRGTYVRPTSELGWCHTPRPLPSPIHIILRLSIIICLL